jgi:hypothetical protein
MHPRSYFEAQLANGSDGGGGAANGPGRPVEARQKAVARRVDLAASEVRQLGADCGVVPFDELAPRAITELRRPFGRSHDVGEQDG